MPILTGECVPAGSSFPIADINNVLGGAMQVADSTARLAIHSSRRRAGMRVWQIDTGIEYMLVGGIADENWQPITRVGAASPEASVTGCFVGHPYAEVESVGDGGTIVRAWIFNGVPGANTGWV